MYVYDCNVILTLEMKNRSDIDMIQAFTELTGDLKSFGIKLGFHFMENEAPTTLKMAMTTMDIK